MNPIVSIIIPAYNIENDISDCLDSIATQTYRNLQILIIVDGSEDKTSEICEYYSQNDSRISMINIHNLGVSNARNIGISVSYGDYVMFIDGDDTVSEDWIESYIVNAIATEADVVFGGLTKITEEQTEKMMVTPGVFDRSQIWKKLCDVNFGFWIYGFVSNKIIKSSILKENGILFDTEMIVQEDIDVTIKILEFSKKISAISSCGYYYRPSLTYRCQYIDLIKNKVNQLVAATKYSALSSKEITSLQCSTKQNIISDLKYTVNTKEKFYRECQQISCLLKQPEYSKYTKGLVEFLLTNMNWRILYFVIKAMIMPHDLIKSATNQMRKIIDKIK